MIERLADFLLALKSREESRIALESHERHFDGDGLPDFKSVALKIEAMPLRLTSAIDLEAVIQHIADFDLVGHGNLCFVKDGLAAEIA